MKTDGKSKEEQKNERYATSEKGTEWPISERNRRHEKSKELTVVECRRAETRN